MRIDRVGTDGTDTGVRHQARLRWDSGETTLVFDVPEWMGGGPVDGSPFLVAALLPAMALGEDLVVDAPVSPLLARRIATAARYYQLWNPQWREPTITMGGESPVAPSAAGVGCFFSRGIDSTYSAAVPRVDPGPLTHLIHSTTLATVHGPQVRESELARCREVADRVGLPLDVVSTNLRDLTDPLLGWADVHGAGLAALALACGGGIGAMVIASTADMVSLGPCGSHPLLDPLFSTESVTVHHDPVDLGRHDKVTWLARHRPDLLANLKVCFAEDRPDNCGRCRKCLLTMMSLQGNGVLGAATEFPDRIDPEAVRSLRLGELNLRTLWMQAAQQLGTTGDDGRVRAAAMEALHRSAKPTVRERIALAAARRKGGPLPYDPSRSTSWEKCFQVETNRALFLLRDGKPYPEEPPG